MATSDVEIEVMGTVRVIEGGVERALQPGQRQLLALLVASGPDGATADRLADEIWSDRLPAGWPNSLRVAVSRLRRRSGLDVVSVGGRYRLGIALDRVDAWRLLAAAAGLGPTSAATDEAQLWDPALEPLLASPHHFPDVTPSPLLLQVAGDLAAAQRELLARLASSDHRPSPAELHRLAAHVVADPFDEGLVAAVATIHLEAGATATALGLLERCRRERRRAFDLDLGPELEQLEAGIRSRAVGVEPSAPAEPRPVLPVPLARLHDLPLVGRETELDRLVEVVDGRPSPAALLRAPAGHGKTALLARLAGALAADRTAGDPRLVYVAGIEDSGFGLAPLTAAVPGFLDAVNEVTSDAAEDHGIRLRLLAESLVGCLRAEAGGVPIVLVIDDAHWLDGQSCELIDHLIRAELGHGLVNAVVVAARDDPDGPRPWSRLEASIVRWAEPVTLSLGPLGLDHVEALVAAIEPDLPLLARHQKAGWLHRASAGIPAVALRLLELDPAAEYGADDGATDGAGVFDRLVASLPEPVAQVGVAAAVMGRRFGLTDVGRLLDRPADELFDAIDHLAKRGLVVETPAFDRFELSHQLVLDAFLRSVSRGRVARLHHAAAGLVTGTHDLARHRAAAGSLVPADVALGTVTESARLHLAAGAYWESVDRYRLAAGIAAERAAELDTATGRPGHLPLVDQIDWARALSLSGQIAEARVVRRDAFDAALADGDGDLAVAAAVAGLPEAESPDGEVECLQQLEQVSADGLSPASRLTRALVASRHAGLIGRIEASLDWAAVAAAEAVTDGDRVEVALAERNAGRLSTGPSWRLERLDRRLAGLAPPRPLRCRVAQARALDLFELGRLDEADTERTTFASLATEIDDPLRVWHALILDALFHEVRGHFAAADDLADQAQVHGRRAGIASAGIVRLAQTFFRLEVGGQLADLVDTFDQVPVPDGHSQLFAAAHVRAMAAAGRRQAAADLAASLAERALTGTTDARHDILALLAPALAGHRSVAIRKPVMAAIEARRGGALVVGVGLGLVPSIESLWILLDRGVEEGRIPSLAQAIDEADRAGFVAWSVRHRLDLAAETGSQKLRAEAVRLAGGGDLDRLLTDPVTFR